MTFTEAAAQVLHLVGRPLHYKEITAYAIEKSFLSHVGKSPEVTMGARLAALFKKDGIDNPMIRVRPGVFALKEWEESGHLKEMVAKLKPIARTVTAPPETKTSDNIPSEAHSSDCGDVQQSGNAASVQSVESASAVSDVVNAVSMTEDKSTSTRPTNAGDVVDDKTSAAPTSANSASETIAVGDGVVTLIRRRTRIADVSAKPSTAASAVSLSDTDVNSGVSDSAANESLSISASSPQISEPSESAAISCHEDELDTDDDSGNTSPESADKDSSKRRRRRRRKASKTPDNATVVYSAAPMEHGEHGRDARLERSALSMNTSSLPIVIDVGSSANLDPSVVDEATGKDLADVIGAILAVADRAAGPQSLRQLAEACQRKGRSTADLQLLQSQIAASIRADNLRRQAVGARPRFRFVGGRISLSDWLLNTDLVRLEQEALAAAQKYREAARKTFVKKIQELPPHAFIELVLLALERTGLRHVRAAKRAGASGNDAHFRAVMDTGAGLVQAAVVVRKDAREISRDRVAELRGALHHYGPASIGWLITAGSISLGAKEEAATCSSLPIYLYDANAIARLCEQADIAVLRTAMPICIPDLDVLEALRSS